MMKLFAVVNGAILRDLGDYKSPTYTRIHYLIKGLEEFDDLKIESIEFKQLPGKSPTTILYNNAIKTVVALKSAISLIRDRPIAFFAYPHSLSTIQNQALFKLCKLIKLPIVLDVHDTMEQSTAIGDGRSALNVGIEGDCLRNSTLISFSLNKSMWEYLINAYKIPQGKKVVFVPNAFEDSLMKEYIEPYKGIEGRFNICYIGALSKNRGIDPLVEACSRLHEKCPYLRLFLFGPYGIGISSELKNAIERSDFIQRKEVPRIDLPRALHEIDLFIMPYNPQERYMNLCSPTKFFEYIGTGRPIVSTKCKSVEDMIINGVIYSEYGAKELEAAIEPLIQSPELREKISDDLFKLRSNHTWNERAKRIHDAVKSIKDQ